MDSRNNYLCDIWPEIFSRLNEINIRNLMLVDKHFNLLLKKSKLLDRDKWHWVDYTNITDSAEITNPGHLYDAYPLRNGDLAIGLTGQYIHFYNNRDFDNYGYQYLPYPNWEDHQDILVFCSEKKYPTVLSGHVGAIMHVIQHDVNTLASLGYDENIIIWDKFNGDIKIIIDLQISDPSQKPIHLISLNCDELACIYQNCRADVWNIHTGKFVKQLFQIEGQITTQWLCRRQDNLMLIGHNLPGTQLCSNGNNNLTVWDIKDEKIIDQINLEELRPELLNCAHKTIKNLPSLPDNYFSHANQIQGMQVIGHQKGIAIVEHTLSGYYFIDTKNENTSFCFPSKKTQHRFLENGKIIILTHLPNELLIYSDYCHQLKDFKIKYRTPDISKMQIDNMTSLQYRYEYFTDRAFTILPNGNIITYYWETGDAKQWCLETQEWIQDFSLEIPSLALNLKEKCRYREALTCLPNGNILACDYQGVIAIWNSKTGKLLLNMNITTQNNNMELIADYADCSKILPNGNLFVKWRDTLPNYNGGGVGDHCRNRLLRFSIWDKVQQNDKSLTCDENENQLRLKL